MQQISVRIQKVVSLYKNLFIFILQCQWIGLGHKHCCVSVVSIFYPSFCLSFVCRSITFGFVWKNLICSKYYVLCILMQMKLAAVMKKNRWIQWPTRTIGYNIVSFHIQHSVILTTWLCMYRYMTWSMYILYIPRYITNMYPALTSLFIQCICHWVCMNAVRCFLSVVRKYIIELFLRIWNIMQNRSKYLHRGWLLKNMLLCNVGMFYFPFVYELLVLILWIM